MTKIKFDCCEDRRRPRLQKEVWRVAWGSFDSWPKKEALASVWIVHNCTIFLCSLDVRNIVQGGDPPYAGFFSTQGSGGYT